MIHVSLISMYLSGKKGMFKDKQNKPPGITDEEFLSPTNGSHMKQSSMRFLKENNINE